MSEECLVCGLYEDEHHEFRKPNLPLGCKCDAREWLRPDHIPPVCEKFTEDGTFDDTLCDGCQHLKECHK